MIATRPSRADLVYLAQPIDLGRAPADLIEYTIGELQAMSLTSYNPLGAFNVSGRPSPVVNQVNEAAMMTATGAVAFLPKDVATVGTPAEIAFMRALGVPVLVLTDHAESWVVAGWAADPTVEVQPLSEYGVSAGLDWLTDAMSAARPGKAPITFERKRENATLPTTGYDTDAGYDLYACEDVLIPARGQANVSCGVAVDIPDGMWAEVRGRSSTLKNLGLMVAPTVGVIDEGYTGELFAPVVSVNDEPIKIETGQRIAQLILHHAPGQRFRPTWGVTRIKDRGEAGFGSTGR